MNLEKEKKKKPINVLRSHVSLQLSLKHTSHLAVRVIAVGAAAIRDHKPNIHNPEIQYGG